mgnify:CR=1 FL=1
MTATHSPDQAADAGERETIFLSPRVLDEGAFERFSSELRELIDKAIQQQANLAEMVRSADNAGPRMEKLAEAQRLAIKSAGDVAKRSEEVRSLIASIDERTSGATEAEARLDARTASLDETVARAESTLTRAEQLLARIQSASATIQSAAEVADRAETARRALEASALKADESAHRVQRALGEYMRLAQELAEPLATERASAIDATNQLRSAAEDCRSLVADGARAARSLETALREVESWRGVLIDADLNPALPPSLQCVADELRAGVMREIAEMASAMRRVAERGPSIERKPTPPVPHIPAAHAATVVTRPSAPAPLSPARAPDAPASGAD